MESDFILATITRISTDSDGTQGNNSSYSPVISANGRYVAFSSAASNLVAGDTNNAQDIFLKDTQTGSLTLVSKATGGTQGNSICDYETAISADGRYVVFSSSASNLVTGDANGFFDIFLKDTLTGGLTRISTASDGAEGAGNSYDPSISADGRYVAYQSAASNLVSNDTNYAGDIFLKDIQSGSVILVSQASNGTKGNSSSVSPTISADGRYVAFLSRASNLVAGDTNNSSDIFLKDTESGSLTRISTTSDGVQSNDASDTPAISSDGRYVVFSSSASNLVTGDTNGKDDIFLKDTQTGSLTRVSTTTDGVQVNGHCYTPAISADGRYVVFYSLASNIVAGDTNISGDIFIKDTQTGSLTKVSTASDGTEGNYGSESPILSSDGRYVAFRSIASNLVANDSNGSGDIFRVDLQGSSNTAPTLATPAALSFTDTPANDTFSTFSDTLSAYDSNGDTLTYSISGGAVSGTTDSRTGTYGTLSLNIATGAYTFIPNDTAIEALSTNASETYSIAVSDGSSNASATLTINITAVEDADDSASEAIETEIHSQTNYTLASGEIKLFLEGKATYGSGNDDDNVIVGNSRKNIIDGGAGNDSLGGAGGKDILTGGEGEDTFGIWDTSKSSIDAITDFESGVDIIELDINVFTDTGFISVTNIKEADAGESVIYVASSGKLYYDPDGAGSGAKAVQIATLVGKPTLSEADISFA